MSGKEHMRYDPLADAFRRWGYLQADLDALGRIKPLEHPDLKEALEGVPPEEVNRWRGIYCGPIGVEFMHIMDRESLRWIAAWMEGTCPLPDGRKILQRIASAELFERFLHTRYVGSKRFSIEGVAGLIPLLDSILNASAEFGAELIMIAMSHRGRLNVMANVVGIPGADIFAGMEDVDPRSVLGSGDVRYHLGATGKYVTAPDETLEVHLVTNPSHLEAVDPVLMGRTRARQQRVGKDGQSKVLPIALHGDAAFAGQGVTAEILNLADLEDYSVGGTIHVIVNNLIGFTTEPMHLHSTRFSSDLARRLPIPILHVNGEEPEAIVRAGRFAVEYRDAFHRDVVIDFIGYRRYGHSEVEDPTTTQPILYKAINSRPRLWELYAKKLGVKDEELERLQDEIQSDLGRQQEEGKKRKTRPKLYDLPDYWAPYRGGYYDPSLDLETGVPSERLEEIARRMTTVPDGFHLHPKVERLLAQRMEMVEGKRPVDWGMAEALAFGSLLWDGTLVRLAGQDSRRGTFNQRHSLLVDTETGESLIPLQHLHASQGDFTIVDSPLSEASALGFEYGYSRDYPDALVCWEAQFGDFANGAQVIIDQFVSAGEAKWELLSGIVLLLPHGYEGQGPEHSSARLERFLQLAAKDNIQVCQPSTACQYYHLLRRQVLWSWRKPLIVITPKSLLRAAAAACPIHGFADGGRFHWILPDRDIDDAERVIVCSGKIAHDLRSERKRRNEMRTAIICIEQFYPFPARELRDQINRYKRAKKILWVQEEPANMGAFTFIRPRLQLLAGDRHVTSVKRSESATPATGSPQAHALEHRALLNLAFA
ncbi:MAG: 2-oxoglutarate dehydrogenase E1 component [Candidatus Latescibacteria bacterium]|nr:2-oxoglutarate dehydrogenase E1 component [Candidatus Latescibacterota bacterium]NIM21421.1 2-oxoglutarate dehydrogenase E1 component [Candidatus Latescibacterota bacterium]NIM65602.1 2-oxoglutarate dehydrogenase E1 component [Candidatus Latescibacterota bacterium]NIO01982.1 2-oxoglutarate dehydrogenase E1 component [Candidatus Latescibacterota bacterium]NIO28794.1 2-oxoglutarate dehydrogenase E1 component [Candidatus Latescibacterota bacterium]